MPTAACAWSRNSDSPDDKLNTFPSIFLKRESRHIGSAEIKAKGESKKVKVRTCADATGVLFRTLTLFLFGFVSSYLLPFALIWMVARDGIEPPTPAFSGPRSTN
jgi:hypothetical protein